jgi:hypothetical protein
MLRAMEKHAQPPPPRLSEEPPSQSGLQARSDNLALGRKAALDRVGQLVEAQKGISEELSGGLQAMQQSGRQLDALDARARQTGILAALTRAFSRRRAILEKRSIAEGLLTQYETVSVSLRRASAFADELHLCALELQEEVDHLHVEQAASHGRARAAAERVMALEQQLDALDEDPSLTPATIARRTDQLRFEERTTSSRMELYRAGAQLCRQELEPARALRDTVLQLHEEMARFVLQATSSVNVAGRRIQALGMAADAPAVVAELNASLQQLDAAMNATEHYLDQAHVLLTQVLPELSAKIEGGAADRRLDLAEDLDAMSRSRARELADRALREAARAEVDGLDRDL